MRQKREGAVLTVLALCGAAAMTSCSVTTPSAESSADQSAQRSVVRAAPGFDSCAALRAWYVRAALRRVTAWGLDYPYGPYPDSGLEFAAAARTSLDAVGNGDTGTNLQEQDVDEADFAKTDGERVVLIEGGDLVVIDVTGSVPDELGRLALPPRLRSGELLLDGDNAVVLGSARRLFSRLGSADYVSRYAPSTGSARTLVATVNLSDPTTPVLDRLDRFEGELLTAREHDGTIRVVVSAAPELPFVSPGRHRTSRKALARNREIVRAAPVQDWLPLRSTLGQRGKHPLLDCDDVVRPNGRSALGAVTVLTLDADDPDGFTATGVAADADLVYASATRMYVATGPTDSWAWWRPTRRAVDPAWWRSTTTEIHAFDISGAETAYVATGRVRGTVADRWSFSEYDGRLRVAASRGNAWRPRETVISILREEGDRLVVEGRVGGMGVTEQVEAVRWFGDLAVVVTFRQIDPLYTVDLADPQHPRVTAELKIPGYSAYLHPLGDDMLLGIGQDATRRGTTQGPQAAIFDLSDQRHPSRLDSLELESGGFTAVERDARAFTYLPASRLALIPVSDQRSDTVVMAVRVTPTGQLVSVGSAAVPGADHRIRMLPLGGNRVALVGGGNVAAVVAAHRL